MSLWSKIWSALDKYCFWVMDSDSDAVVREIAERLPDDPRDTERPPSPELKDAPIEAAREPALSGL